MTVQKDEGGTMKYRGFVATAFAAALAVPVAFGAPAKKPPPTGAGCKPAVSVILKGTLTNDPQFVGAGTFTMNITGANKPGKVFVGGAATINVGVDTKVRRQNAPKLIASLASGDRAVVHLRACKGVLPLDAADLATLTALRVNAKAPAAP
jgi:hypothetical protein